MRAGWTASTTAREVTTIPIAPYLHNGALRGKKSLYPTGRALLPNMNLFAVERFFVCTLSTHASLFGQLRLLNANIACLSRF